MQVKHIPFSARDITPLVLAYLLGSLLFTLRISCQVADCIGANLDKWPIALVCAFWGYVAVLFCMSL